MPGTGQVPTYFALVHLMDLIAFKTKPIFGSFLLLGKALKSATLYSPPLNSSSGLAKREGLREATLEVVEYSSRCLGWWEEGYVSYDAMFSPSLYEKKSEDQMHSAISLVSMSTDGELYRMKMNMTEPLTPAVMSRRRLVALCVPKVALPLFTKPSPRRAPHIPFDVNRVYSQTVPTAVPLHVGILLVSKPIR